MTARFSKLIISLFLSSLFFSSCKKGTPSWDVDVVAPLINSSLTIDNIIPDSLLQHNPDNSLVLVYNSSLYTLSADSLFKINDTTLNNNYISPFTQSVNPGGSIIPTVANTVKYSLGGVQLHSAAVRSGKMLLSIKSGIFGLTDFTYVIPSMTDVSGKTFSVTVTIPAATGASSPGIYSGSFDLSGYNVNLTGASGTSVNTMMTSYSAIVTPAVNGGYTTTINSGDAVQISNTFDKIIMQYAKGYFGSSVTTAGPDSTNVSLFNHITDGTLKLEDIDINFSIENSIGVDARVTIDNLSSINSKTGATISLVNNAIGSPININRAVDNSGSVASSLYQFALTPSNSNIKPFVENLPDKMSYQMQFEINPLGNVSGSNDFIYYDKLIKTQMNMSIPLSLIANNLTLADTLDFSMGKETDNVNSGTLTLYAANGFPFTAEAQLYLMDDNLTVVDSLMSSNVILAPQLDAYGICAGQRSSQLVTPVNEDKMELLRSTKKIELKIRFNTANQPNYVKIYSFYRMDVKLVGDFNYTVGKKD